MRSHRRMREFEAVRPRTPGQLHRFVKVVLGLDVPRQAISAAGTPPFAYLCHAFFERPTSELVAEGADKQVANAQPTDAVVWANRGGGKTMLGATATLLDLLFKPGVQVRILGGSLEQASRMYEHLLALCDRPAVQGVLAGQPTQRRVQLVNGSTAAVLAQSQRSVRGVRVHKLRCDEVEEFDPEVWEAAQLVTRSGWCGDTFVHGSVEALSTMHRPLGLMSKLTQHGQHGQAAQRDGAAGKAVFRWNYLDVIERCPASRPCEPCVLFRDCKGKAKQAAGFVKIDDLVAQWHRTSLDMWAAEMTCERPRLSDRVYPNFELSRHVAATVGGGDDGNVGEAIWVGGMDFGLRSPLVMLWGRVHGSDPATAVLHIVDEYIQAGKTLEQHLEAMAQQTKARQLGKLRWLGVDPAGHQRNSHTGLSDVQVLRSHGLSVRTRQSGIRPGIEQVRRRLDRGTLVIHPRCAQLIEAMQGYHFDMHRLGSDEPVKDGPDHACDALRYMIVNLEAGEAPVQVRRWA